MWIEPIEVFEDERYVVVKDNEVFRVKCKGNVQGLGSKFFIGNEMVEFSKLRKQSYELKNTFTDEHHLNTIKCSYTTETGEIMSEALNIFVLSEYNSIKDISDM